MSSLGLLWRQRAQREVDQLAVAARGLERGVEVRRERAKTERDEHRATRRAAQQLGDPVRRRPLEVVEHDHRRLDEEAQLLVAEGVHAAPGEHAVAVLARELGQFPEQPGLADPGLAVDGEQRRAEGAHRIRYHAPLICAAGERCHRPARVEDPSPGAG